MMKKCIFSPKKILIEQSAYLKDYKLLVISFKSQIVENFCLIDYAMDHPEIYPSNKNHWEKELRAYLNNIRSTTLKSNADIKKVLSNILIDISDLKNPNKIYEIVQEKFEDENFDLDFQYCEHFTDCIDILINCLAKEISLRDFFQKCFRNA